MVTMLKGECHESDGRSQTTLPKHTFILSAPGVPGSRVNSQNGVGDVREVLSSKGNIKSED